MGKIDQHLETYLVKNSALISNRIMALFIVCGAGDSPRAQGFIDGLALNVTDSQLNLKMSFETKGHGALLAALEGSISQLTFGKGNEETVIKGKHFGDAFRMEGERTEISLDKLDLEYPRLTLSGKFTIDRKEPFVVMKDSLDPGQFEMLIKSLVE